MKLPVCCRDFPTNKRISEVQAVRDKLFVRRHMLRSASSTPFTSLGCTWAADCQTSLQSSAYVANGSSRQDDGSEYVASGFVNTVLDGSIGGLRFGGSSSQAASANLAFSHTEATPGSKQQECLVHTLADMRPAEDVPVYVMLPLDTVNADGVFKYAYIPWFAQALQVLALSGVHGVAVDVWWCAVERAPHQYSWTGYKQLFEMVRGVGLKLQVVLSFHACGGNVGDLAQVPLPAWVLEAGVSDPDIFFTDRPRESGLGQRNKEYLSIWADDCPVLPGGHGGAARSPMQAYGDFMMAFREVFHEQLGTLIEEVVVGSGPCGELRYPSYVEANGWRFPGVGEFQCYDRRALASLAAAAQAVGRPEWGYAGPHDSGGYNSSPGDTGFFAPGGSWETEYGNFFLNWYSSCLLQHGERLLQLANKVFGSYKQPPQQPPAGPMAQAQAVVKQLQDWLTGHEDSSSSNNSNLAAIAAAAAVAAAAAGSGVCDSDHGAVTTAAMQAKGLLEQVQRLQAGSVTAVLGRISSSTTGSNGDDDGAGSSSSIPITSPGASSVPSAGSSTPPSISCSTSATCLTPQGSAPLAGQQQPEHPSFRSGRLNPAAVQTATAQTAAVSPALWEQLASPHAQALATSILQQLQQSNVSNFMAAGVSRLHQQPPAGAAAVIASTDGQSTQQPADENTAANVVSMSADAPTIASVSSSSLASDAVDLAGLLSASQQHLAGLSLCAAGDASRGSDLCGQQLQAGLNLQPNAAALEHYNSSGSIAAADGSETTGAAAAFGTSGADLMPAVGAVVAPALIAGRTGPSLLRSGTSVANGLNNGALSAVTTEGALGAALATDAVSSKQHGISPKQGSIPNSASSSGLAAVPEGAAVTAAATEPAGAAAAAATPVPNLYQIFLEVLSGLGIDVGQQQPKQLQQQQSYRRRQQERQQLIITLKIAGVHWWYNSTSHASELTAGYYNTDSRDGYGPILAMCGKYDANCTLTCVEMCDAQHPSYALCGPEGLLRQIRAMAAKQQVSLSGENALPIFTPGGVDAVALDRVVSNVRSCRALPLRSCSSWPGPAATSSSTAALYYNGNGSGLQGYSSYTPWQQQQQQQQHFGYYYGNGQYFGGTAGGYSRFGVQEDISQQQQHYQQQQAYQYHPGAGMHTGGHLLSYNRNFSELGQLLHHEHNHQAAYSSNNSSWHQQQHGQGVDSRSGLFTAANGNGSSGGGASGQQGSPLQKGSFAAAGDEQLLPAMRAFTFLRLGAEILQPEVHASWMRFMHRMLNERA